MKNFFYLQLQLIKTNLHNKTKFKGFNFSKVGEYFNSFYNNLLSFKLTDAQKKSSKKLEKTFLQTLK